MKLIVGLGNPGKKYEKTRHNVGFMFVDSLAKQWGLKFTLDKAKKCEIAETLVNGKKVIIIKPITFMNLSGEAVYLVKSYYNIKEEDILVIYDDLDLPFSQVKIKPFGGTGGHKGMKSIIELLNTEKIKRIRIGIGSPEESVIDFVLSSFSKKDLKVLNDYFSEASNIIYTYCTKTFDNFMNAYNR